MKKILWILVVAGLFIYLIYGITNSSKLNILSIGDIYSNGYTTGSYFPSYNDYYQSCLKKYDRYDIITVHNLIELKEVLNNNELFNDSHIKKLIKNSDLLIINIGIEELSSVNNIINLNYINNYLSNFELVIKEIIGLNKNIYLVNIPNEVNINNKYRLIVNDYYDGLINKYQLNLIDVRNQSLESINQDIYQVLNGQKLTS